ncbi:MAG: hypothetical protein L0Z62_23755 [Gemmataceae bacterium]|nr:hypothetical protein [Gemmataceae bacterium]
MTPLKRPCPGCSLSLQIVKELPARVRCPRCGTRFLLSPDGTTTLAVPAQAGDTATLSPALPSMPAPPSPWLKVSILGGGALAVLLLIGLVLFCIMSGGPEPSGPASPSDPVAWPNEPTPQLIFAPVGFSKPNPQGDGAPVGAARSAQPPGAPAAAAKALAAGGGPAFKDQARVNEAIDRGVVYLKGALERSSDARLRSHPTGATALIGLTLLSCGVPADDPAVVRAAKQVREEAPTLTATYDLSVCVWFLDRLGDRGDRALLRQIGLQLIAGQGFAGGWNYQCQQLSSAQQQELLTLLHNTSLTQASAEPAPPAPAPQPVPVPEKPTAPGKKPPVPPIIKPGPRSNTLPANLSELPVFRFRLGQKLSNVAQWHEDNSLSQFVLLALWATQRHGVPAERSLAFTEARFRASQNDEGTWGYTWGVNLRSDSMTCAGLLGLAVGRGISHEAKQPGAPAQPEKKDLARDPQIEKALLYLGKRIGKAGSGMLPPLDAKQAALLAELQAKLKTATPQERTKLSQEIQQLLRAGVLHGRGRTVGSNAWGDLYYLWSVERVAVVYDLDTIGGKDWYAWGAEILLSKQREDGSWSDAFPGAVDTCFALLFLKRVNVAQDLTQKLIALGGAKDPGAKEQEAHASRADPAGIDKTVTADQVGRVKMRSAALPASTPPSRPVSRRRRRERRGGEGSEFAELSTQYRVPSA